MTPEVLFQDGGLVAVQKPSGIPTTSPRGPSLVRTLSVALGKPRFLHPTSRLDAEVSGVVVFALSAAANRRVLEAREAKRYRRSYLAILPLGEAIPVVIDAPIGIDPADPRKRRVTSGGKPSRTSIGKAEPGAAGRLLTLQPETGRTHQLRVHLQHVGSPIFGDPHYGGPRRIVRDNGAVVTARRVMLHCREVQIGDGPPIEAPLPEDFVAAWARLAG